MKITSWDGMGGLDVHSTLGAGLGCLQGGGRSRGWLSLSNCMWPIMILETWMVDWPVNRTRPSPESAILSYPFSSPSSERRWISRVWLVYADRRAQGNSWWIAGVGWVRGVA
ncbi:hypothetical protein, variant [Blastomyces gilchristii SLH14081]|uniref:Uncharacterized protein n=1 Tax=Blastomyces gilchristii (strain SLH14081) TaxID=559298 RepID=A0A179UHI0_BLAGS|nr:uncharacterized protein BDBG_16843 [Blastomyces gilchristii SLH14081]XP_031577811.1 hypothetical protein, variant [Blastomyces gilchristii SLH14081]OAT07504.1 hypothetical protein BDBG_16843 [Blastomyces gilchristii SLH14081]OAT07505.1 hypothetical protein, variant [Blastomyces gilchristii SLH14081]